MKVLITAGPTREKIDPVRFITNYSSGKMGYALAQIAKNLKYEVTLISGPVNISPPKNIKFIQIETAEEMHREVMNFAQFADIIIMSAAVADYTPISTSNQKLKKADKNLILELERTTDIIAELGKIKRDNQLLIGFAAESEDLLINARSKLKKKNLDWIIANDISKKGIGFQSEKNQVTLISKAGKEITTDLHLKSKIAEIIFEKCKLS